LFINASFLKSGFPYPLYTRKKMELTITVEETGGIPAGNRIAVIGPSDAGLTGSIAAVYMVRTIGLTLIC
jgi:predicted ATP-grasp superfamily ATP-dependent carboligase